MWHEEKLKDLLPEARERNITYTTEDGLFQPAAERYMVSVGHKNRRPNSVYLITEARLIKHKNPLIRRYKLKVLRCPDLLPVTHYAALSGRAWVGGEEAVPMWWNTQKRS